MPAVAKTLFAGLPRHLAALPVHVLITGRRRLVAPYAATSRPSTGEE
jgi:hypothetical protein